MTSTAPVHPRLLSVADACRALGIGRTRLYETFNSGDLQYVKLGRRTLVRADELARFIDSLTAAAGGPQ